VQPKGATFPSDTREYRREVESSMPSPSGKDAEMQDRAVPGHWEGDLISGSRNSHVVTVERHSRFARHGRCRPRPESASSQTPRYPAMLADLGPGTGDGQTPGLYGGHGYESLLL
jgi:hypothetical protein